MFYIAINRINHYPVDKISIIDINCVVQWIEIYLVDKVIYLLNNLGLQIALCHADKFKSRSSFVGDLT